MSQLVFLSIFFPQIVAVALLEYCQSKGLLALAALLVLELAEGLRAEGVTKIRRRRSPTVLFSFRPNWNADM